MLRLGSMRARMTAAFILAMTPFLLLASGIVIGVSSHLSEIEARVLLHRTTARAARMLMTPGWQDDLARLTSEPEVRARSISLIVVNQKGHVVWRSQKDLPRWPHLPANAWRDVEMHVGRLVVVAMRPASPPPWSNRGLRLTELLVLSLCVLLAASAGVWALVGRTLSPIHRLARQANEASTEHFDVRLTPPSQDAEVVDLVRTLNGMLTRLGETAASKGRFYAAASHELRTPLQALSGHLELALSRPRTTEEYRGALEEAQRQSNRLTSLVKSLLLLHQVEHQRAAPEPTDWAEVCRLTADSLRPQFEARRLVLRERLPEEAVLPTPPTHADILIRNLLENAARYALPDSEVGVTVTQAGLETRLRVENRAALTPETDPQTWLEAFGRPDAARTASTGGNGLGLAICRAIAQANGWKFSIRAEEDRVCAEVVVATEEAVG